HTIRRKLREERRRERVRTAGRRPCGPQARATAHSRPSHRVELAQSRAPGGVPPARAHAHTDPPRNGPGAPSASSQAECQRALTINNTTATAPACAQSPLAVASSSRAGQAEPSLQRTRTHMQTLPGNGLGAPSASSQVECQRAEDHTRQRHLLQLAASTSSLYETSERVARSGEGGSCGGGEREVIATMRKQRALVGVGGHKDGPEMQEMQRKLGRIAAVSAIQRSTGREGACGALMGHNDKAAHP
ncbi:hypothetical protein B0H11DRAFT_1921492, partial [Mycena galericulata]